MNDLKYVLEDKQERIFAKRRRFNRILNFIGLVVLIALLYAVLVMLAQ